MKEAEEVVEIRSSRRHGIHKTSQSPTTKVVHFQEDELQQRTFDATETSANAIKVLESNWAIVAENQPSI